MIASIIDSIGMRALPARARRALLALLASILVAAMPVANAFCALDSEWPHGADVSSAPAHPGHDHDGTSDEGPCCDAVGMQIIESVKPIVQDDALPVASSPPLAAGPLAHLKRRSTDFLASRPRVRPAPPEPVLRRVPRLLI